jgi:hypothetical protein
VKQAVRIFNISWTLPCSLFLLLAIERDILYVFSSTWLCHLMQYKNIIQIVNMFLGFCCHWISSSLSVPFSKHWTQWCGVSWTLNVLFYCCLVMMWVMRCNTIQIVHIFLFPLN